MNSPQLWHRSGCQLRPTCFTFYLVRVQIFRNRGCTCIVEEHPRVWHVRIALLTPYGHRFWPDCWPWGTDVAFLSDQDQRQPSSPSLSPGAPFSSIALLVFEISPPMMYHALPCSWATAMPLGISLLFAVLSHSETCFSAFFPNQNLAYVREKSWLSWGRTWGRKVWDTDPHNLYQSTERWRDKYQYEGIQ